MVIPVAHKQLSINWESPPFRSKYNQRQDKGPVYHPLREKPFTRKTLKA